jgi:arylsulfatase
MLSESKDNERPNVVLITADQLRRDALGIYKNNIVKTPNIDNIANEGRVFDNHFTQNPVCMPSRWSILTGKYPSSHGIRDNGVLYKGEDLDTLASILKNKGYNTVGVGKMHFTPQLLYKISEDEDWPKGFFGLDTRHLTDDSKRGEYLEYLKDQDMSVYKYVLDEGRSKIKEDLKSSFEGSFTDAPQVYKSNIPVELHQTSWIADKAVDFINENNNEPFFIWCSFVDPHHPFNPPEPYFSMYNPKDMPDLVKNEGVLEDTPEHILDMLRGSSTGIPNYNLSKITEFGWKQIKSKYYGMVSLIDFNIGKITDALKKNKIFNNTIIIISSDHGELLGDNGLLFKGPFHYDGLIRVPLIIKWGDRICGGSRVDKITNHIDLMPTVLSIIGVPVPRSVQGSNIEQIIYDKGDQGPEFALIEHHASDFGLNIRTIRSKEWRFTYYGSEKYGELYDLYNDPNEIKNLWNKEEFKVVKSMLMKKLIDILITTEDMTYQRLVKY